MNMSITRSPQMLQTWEREFYPLLSWLSETPARSDTNTWMPHVDIREEKDAFVVYADIPGVDPKDIEVEMDGNTLRLRGERKSEQEDKQKNSYCSERVVGKFCRQITLSESIEGSQIAAKVKHGVLEVILPKKVETRARKIVIASE